MRYQDMSREQLEEVVRDGESSITYAEFELADREFKRAAKQKLKKGIWRPDWNPRPATDSRRVVLEEVPDMPTEETPF